MVKDNLWTLTTEVDYERQELKRRVRLLLNIFFPAKMKDGWICYQNGVNGS